MMLFSFAYGGFLLLAYVFQVYLIFWRNEFLPVMPFRRASAEALEPTGALLSPVSVFLLLTGIAFILNGYLLLRLSTRRARQEAKNDVFSFVFTPDEKLAFTKLQEAGGEMTQKELSLKTGFSAVKTHRVVFRLQSKGAVETHPFGMTNKLVIKQD